MKTIKGPGIFLAQFIGDEAPFNSLKNICRWAKDKGFVGIQIPTLDDRFIDLQKAAESKTYADEIKGVVRGDDRTTGKSGEGPTFKYDTAYLNRLYYDLGQTKKSNEAKKVENNVALAKLDSARASKIGRLTFSRDYLEREKALSRLTDGNTIIRITTWFLIIFFILVDILPVTWKGLTSRGPYDEYLNETELKIKNDVQENVIDSETKLEIHKLNKEKELADHIESLQAEENARREFSTV